ncbi:O-antigen ligase family protein [Patescibacteria group bacterium]|nr:O-antigen ligase family protein [Patescibacteria group bacterium]
MNERLLRFFLLGSLFFIPLLGSYYNFGYEKTKVLFFILSISLIGFIWLLQKPQTKWSAIKIASLMFILVLFITSALSIDFKLSLLGQEPYFQGLVLYAYLFLFSLLVSSAAITLEHVALVLTGSAIIVSLVAIQDWILLNIFSLPVLNYAGRVVSTFGQPNFYAGFLLLSLPFAYYLFKNSNRKLSYFGFFSALISIVGIFVSYSRSAILMTLMLVVLGLIAELKNKFKIGLIVLGVVLITILMALKLSSGIVGNEISRPIKTLNPDLTKESIEKRIYIWPVAFKITMQKPLTGYGLENIDKAFAGYFKANKHLFFEENLKISPVLISLKELTIDRSHNYPLDLFLFSGAFSFLSWAVLVILLFKKSVQKILDQKQHGYIFIVSLAIYLIWIQFQNQSIVHLMYFWFLVGLIDQGFTD